MPDHPSRRRASSRAAGLLLPALTALLAVACSSPAATPIPTGAPPSAGPNPSSQAPSASPAVGAIDHPTGATDVILRLEQGGGLVPMEFSATQAPLFTLYGNGVMVYQPKTTTYPQPDATGVTKGIPWRTAKLDEDQIQELLRFALGAGGLGAARDSYPATGVADAPDTMFTINAGGVAKRVVVNALGMDMPGGVDAGARTAFGALATRLGDIDRGGTIGSDTYVAERVRAVLLERAEVGGVPIEWPWPAIKPTDFKAGAGDGTSGPTLPHRTLTPDELGALGLTGIEGGAQGLVLKGPDGKAYSLILRPLLADEAS
jgi:hypothetical protein